MTRTWGFLLALVCLSGCDPTPVLFKAVAMGAPIVAGGFSSLGAADKIAQDRIRTEAKTDAAVAKTDLVVHLKRYDVADKVLKTTMNTMQAALDSAPLLKAAHDKQATLDLVESLRRLYEDVRVALAELGITFQKVSF